MLGYIGNAPWYAFLLSVLMENIYNWEKIFYQFVTEDIRGGIYHFGK